MAKGARKTVLPGLFHLFPDGYLALEVMESKIEHRFDVEHGLGRAFDVSNGIDFGGHLDG